MPRQREIALTKTKKKGRAAKDKLIANVRELFGKYEFCYVLRITNQRNKELTTVREKLKPARLIYGKNKVLHVALGRNAGDELAEGTHQISKTLVGNRGLLFANEAPKVIEEFFKNYQPESYARAGAVATQTVVLEEGFEALSAMPHSLETRFRDLGLPTRLVNGKIEVLGRTTVCEEGKEINSSQAQILKLLGHQLSRFEGRVEHVWSSESFVSLMES